MFGSRCSAWFSSTVAVLALLPIARAAAQAGPEPDTAPAAPAAQREPADEGAARLAEGVEPPSEPVEDDDVVVTATRSARRLADVPVATEVLTRREILRSGAQNAADALRTRAGVELVQGLGNTGVRLQGLDSKYVLVLIDGRRLAGRVDGLLDLRRFAAEDIERIEIVRGAGSALYGSDAIGGVINIITRRPRAGLHGDLLASYGSRNELDLSASGSGHWNPLSLRLSGGFHRADAYDLRPSDPATNGSTFDEAHGTLDLEAQLSPILSVRTDGTYRSRTQRAIDVGAGGAVFDREQRNDELRLSLQPRLELNASDSITVDAHYTQVRDRLQLDQRLSNALDQREQNRDRLLELGAQFESVWGAHAVTAGLEGSFEWMRSPRITAAEAQRQRVALYAQDEWRVLPEPALSLMPGVRLDVDSQFGSHVSPKLTLRCDPLPQLVLRASYGLGFRAPDFKELHLLFENPGVGYVVEGNPELSPESSHGLNLGAEYEALGWLWLSVELSRTDLSDMISPESLDQVDALGSQRYRYINIASAHTQQLDARVRLRAPFGVDAELEYVLTDGRDEVQRRALEGLAAHRASLQLDYTLAALALEASAGVLVVGRRPYYRDDDDDGVDETRYARPHVELRARLEKTFGGWLAIFAGVDNLLDAGDAELTPLAPRTVYGGLSAHL